MTTEYFIAFVILVFLTIAGIFYAIRVSKLEDENEELHGWCCEQERCISNQEMRIEELEMKLAKKDALISILRNEINEKENAK